MNLDYERSIVLIDNNFTNVIRVLLKVEVID